MRRVCSLMIVSLSSGVLVFITRFPWNLLNPSSWQVIVVSVAVSLSSLPSLRVCHVAREGGRVLEASPPADGTAPAG